MIDNLAPLTTLELIAMHNADPENMQINKLLASAINRDAEEEANADARHRANVASARAKFAAEGNYDSCTYFELMALINELDVLSEAADGAAEALAKLVNA